MDGTWEMSEQGLFGLGCWLCWARRGGLGNKYVNSIVTFIFEVESATAAGSDVVDAMVVEA